MTEPLLDKVPPMYMQIYERIKASILSKELEPGAKVPTNRSLVKRYGASIFTVQSAIAALEREGLVERHRKLGTFVKQNGTRLSRIGIYFDEDFLSLPGMDFWRLLYGKLLILLQNEGIEHRLFLGPHPEARFPKSIEQAAKKRDIQALIAPLLTSVDRSACEKIGLPVVSFVNDVLRYDFQGFFNALCQHFKESGCRSIGFISIFSEGHSHVGGVDSIGFMKTAALAGLETRVEWIATPKSYPSSNELERFGYDSFMEMAAKGLPDALAVYPDIMARGVVIAASVSGIRIPKDLKLVFHQNEGNPLFAPFEFTALQSSPGEIANEMLRTARAIFNGEEGARTLIGYKLVAGGGI